MRLDVYTWSRISHGCVQQYHLWNDSLFSVVYKHEVVANPMLDFSWGVSYQKQVSRAVISNYTPKILWDIITCLCSWYLLLPQYFLIQQTITMFQDWRFDDANVEVQIPYTCHLTYGSAARLHYDDVKMGAIASQITSLTIVYSTVYSGADQSKHQSSASLAFVWGIHRGPVNSPHKGPVTRKMFPFDDVIMV